MQKSVISATLRFFILPGFWIKAQKFITKYTRVLILQINLYVFKKRHVIIKPQKPYAVNVIEKNV